MGAKWEPNAVKMLTNIVAKFAIDLGGHSGVKKLSKGLPKGGHTDAKLSQSRSKKRRALKKQKK